MLFVLFLALVAFTVYDVITAAHGWAVVSGVGALGCLFFAIRSLKASRSK